MPPIKSIPLVPEIPAELKIAGKQGRLVPFVGAGVSQLAGCPGWSEFAEKCLTHLLLHNKLNHALLDQLHARKLSPRVILALALNWAKQGGETPIDFMSILHPEGWAQHVDGNRVYRALAALSRHFVTTNYDFWLDTIPPALASLSTNSGAAASALPVKRHCVYKPDQILISTLDRTDASTVTHLHGSLLDIETMVLTTSQYVSRYADCRQPDNGVNLNHTQVFLEHLFGLKSILFVGYGLDELEILEYVILKARRQLAQGSRVASHFILQPFFSHELEIANAIGKYFQNECGVTLIPYLRDALDYAQLIEVLEGFTREISASPLLNAERRYAMEQMLK